MKAVFADAGYWIAALDEDDQLHNTARRIVSSLGEHRIITTEMTLVETLNHMSGLGEYKRRLAYEGMSAIRTNPNVEIVEQTGTQFEDALARYGARMDQRWGMTDCASFLVMEGRGITEALAYDIDFERAGFVALLREGR